MEATMVLDTTKHYPVLLNEIISIITPQHGGTFIDCTFGQGGYTKKILSYKNTKVIALDRDLKTKETAQKISDKFHGRLYFKNKKFSQLDHIKIKDENIRAVVFDLGYSYQQIKDTSKGLSFYSKGMLDMRMGINEFSASDAINKLEKKELEMIFKFFGDEVEAKRIANKIFIERKIKKIDTQGLVNLINNTKKKKNFKTNNATKVFQALRIFVNKEITELINGLIIAAKILEKDGVLAVVTFHSLEDKIVKYFFKSLTENKSISRYLPKIDQSEPLFKMIEKKPRTPLPKELKENIQSRSAKLRYVIKKTDFYDFETDVYEKFKYLIDIENFGNKL
ncbi:16S rRNA (cytosine(1402)-N(4))-methyltransferase RsmH [Candidatus Pelagibacter sp.]|nr:16S rRNA (cytosine(1402)-N(4))-methyltransferase RsmH [Candidatus Pelagibacter sp.]